MKWRTDDESGRRVACGLGSGKGSAGFVLKYAALKKFASREPGDPYRGILMTLIW